MTDVAQVATESTLTALELRSVWPALSPEERCDGFLSLDRSEADDFFEELSTEETARLLGITTTAVKLRLHRGRQALRELLVERRAELVGSADC